MVHLKLEKMETYLRGVRTRKRKRLKPSNKKCENTLNMFAEYFSTAGSAPW
jgi:hypothetical protein